MKYVAFTEIVKSALQRSNNSLYIHLSLFLIVNFFHIIFENAYKHSSNELSHSLNLYPSHFYTLITIFYSLLNFLLLRACLIGSGFQNQQAFFSFRSEVDLLRVKSSKCEICFMVLIQLQELVDSLEKPNLYIESAQLPFPQKSGQLLG